MLMNTSQYDESGLVSFSLCFSVGEGVMISSYYSQERPLGKSHHVFQGSEIKKLLIGESDGERSLWILSCIFCIIKWCIRKSSCWMFLSDFFLCFMLCKYNGPYNANILTRNSDICKILMNGNVSKRSQIKNTGNYFDIFVVDSFHQQQCKNVMTMVYAFDIAS